MDPTASPIISLLSDFGLNDEYVGVMKAVLHQHCAHVRLVDISHSIPAQDIRAGAHLLSRSYSYFPKGSIHLAVVDPGVGSNRRLIVVQADDHTFVGPDNGIFSPVINASQNISVYEIQNSGLWNSTISSTFHGRDILAPVASHIAAGLPEKEVGDRVEVKTCTLLPSLHCTVSPESISGEIIYIDHFGNMCTNISKADIVSFQTGANLTIRVGEHISIRSLSNTYIEGNQKPIALFDSHNQLEIAINKCNASKLLNLRVGTPVIIKQHP